MKYLRWILITTAGLALLSLVLVWTANRVVVKAGKGNLYNSTEKVPHNKVGLLLGTSKFLVSGQINQYYQYRIDAAVKLYKAGKIDFILISGDNSQKHYDEPTTMKNDLVERGIPAERIVLDYAGFRTLDSIVRSRAIFGQKSITIISQKFHNERAIYIADKKGIKAVGYNAKDVTAYYGFKTRVRENFARVKMLLDLAVDKQPKFLGEKIEIR
ncbi:MAG: YdcF family protein [Bacteroidales bacterium]|nr:YdcF family protein [Bacteroidales bacterium]